MMKLKKLYLTLLIPFMLVGMEETTNHVTLLLGAKIVKLLIDDEDARFIPPKETNNKTINLKENIQSGGSQFLIPIINKDDLAVKYTLYLYPNVLYRHKEVIKAKLRWGHKSLDAKCTYKENETPSLILALNDRGNINSIYFEITKANSLDTKLVKRYLGSSLLEELG